MQENSNKIVSSVSSNTLDRYDLLTTYKNYDCDLDNVMEQLDNFGVAVIPNILNREEISNMQNGIWDTVEHLSSFCEKPIDRDNPDTWNTWYELLPTHDMLMQTYSVGHAQFIWDIRQNPKVANVFSKIWSCQPEELLTSYDALSFHLPPEITNRGWYKENDWFHVDAAYTRPEFECVQGFVTGFDVNEGDGSLTIFEGSHKYHQDFAKEFNVTDEIDWYRLDEDHLDFYYDKGCARTNVKASAGSLVLWDSRTVHCGMEPLKTRKEPNFRLVTYVCMTPRAWSSEEVIEQRRQALDELYMTSHCPHRPRLFPKLPQTFGRYIPSVPDMPFPKLTELGMKLSGF